MTVTQARGVDPTIITRDQHVISRAQISDKALSVLYRLKNAGYGAYLVGGGVRDLSLGREPKDFDVATDATPDEVKALFRNCRLIGRRFRLAHVHWGPEIIEVATFRAMTPDADSGDKDHVVEDGLVLRDNVYGTIEEDALRRDFTINALYYNIADFSVVDYAGGMADLQAGRLRLIGDPAVRYREDPVRMLRAVRFAAKLGFTIDSATAAPIPRMADLLDDIPPARLFDEVLKLFMAGQGVETFEALRHHGLFRYLFPASDTALDDDDHGQLITFVARALESTDARVNNDRPVTPAFLFAALLWPAILGQLPAARLEPGIDPELFEQSVTEALERQLRQVAIPKRFALPMREIWALQPRFHSASDKKARRLFAHPRYRAAYDFLLLRRDAGLVDPELADAWQRYTESSEDAPPPTPARRRRRGGRRRGPAPDAGDG
ncbi:polynucleotide adenylyltransferase PcnB [Spiribacter roseus]|uniref:polynucleotide adenylyltransferase PcnB n=1 Tax=Spiribacter roseus TaxID=1855875 RepID=UPI00133051CF|nr:polynucleotide adenylyltransferase PcnB [Spiribacter roseus]KAF0282273.1 poly(A) polymerase [Spiribacter roseus]